MGSVSLPSGMAPHIASGEAIIYPTRKSPLNCGVISAGGVLTVSFTTTITDRENIRGFFHFLAQQGMGVTVYSNNWGETEKNEEKEKPGQNA